MGVAIESIDIWYKGIICFTMTPIFRFSVLCLLGQHIINGEIRLECGTNSLATGLASTVEHDQRYTIPYSLYNEIPYILRHIFQMSSQCHMCRTSISDFYQNFEIDCCWTFYRLASTEIRHLNFWSKGKVFSRSRRLPYFYLRTLFLDNWVSAFTLPVMNKQVFKA